MPPIVLDGTTGITTPGLTNTGTETVVNLTTTGNTILGDASTDTLNVGNGGLVKDASGNVGIGTTSPGVSWMFLAQMETLFVIHPLEVCLLFWAITVVRWAKQEQRQIIRYFSYKRNRTYAY